MRSAAVRPIACVLAACLVLAPAGLSAGERRGATVVVSRLDGSQVRGELIAVRADSLVVRWAPGRDEAIAVKDVVRIRIVKRSWGFLGALSGLALSGSLVLINGSTTSEEEAGLIALIGLSGLVGLAVGTVLGLDRRVPISGEPETIVAGYLEKLRAYSREVRLSGPGTSAGKSPEAMPGAGITARGAASAAHSPTRRWPRFRLSLSATAYSPRTSDLSGASSFRLPEDPSPEAGPYPLDVAQLGLGLWNENRRFGPFGLACEWNDHWSAEIELAPLGREDVLMMGVMTFTSGVDGNTYRYTYSQEYRVDLVSLLAGLTYRPFAPSPFRRHVVEAGAAVGPAFVRAGPRVPAGIMFSLPEVRKAVFCGRIKAAYDFYLYPAVSVGAFIGYRFMRTDFVGIESEGRVEFWATDLPDGPTVERPTVVALPRIGVDASGIFWGVRVGLRI